ncbi:MAG: outer membrane lipoprotein carrier protein LolA [bacterium]|nr:outer membrane lipoprotein carrier protein LolA [bacterium]MCP5065065.1 outer membrane lipoprotein carrier protein LolA [bacterium]
MSRAFCLLLAGALLWIPSAGSAAGGGPIEADPAPGVPVAPAEPGTGSETCGVAMAGRVQAYYDDVRDLSASFQQTTQSVAFGASAGEGQRASGRVEFAKPGKMRWRYTEPEPSEVVSDGSTLWVYDPAAKEVQILEVGEAFLSAAAIQFLLGSGRILETYSVTATDCDATPVHLVLSPLQPATYQRLELDVDPTRGVITRTLVVDVLGNRTEVIFEDLKINLALEPGRFVFQVPDGVRELRIDTP